MASGNGNGKSTTHAPRNSFALLRPGGVGASRISGDRYAGGGGYAELGRRADHRAQHRRARGPGGMAWRADAHDERPHGYRWQEEHGSAVPLGNEAPAQGALRARLQWAEGGAGLRRRARLEDPPVPGTQ